MTREALTEAEAAEWKFCEQCGKELTQEEGYRYDHKTGEAVLAYRYKRCKVGFDEAHTEIDLISQAVLDVLEPNNELITPSQIGEYEIKVGWGNSEIKEAPRSPEHGY